MVGSEVGVPNTFSYVRSIRVPLRCAVRLVVLPKGCRSTAYLEGRWVSSDLQHLGVQIAHLGGYRDSQNLGLEEHPGRHLSPGVPQPFVGFLGLRKVDD